MLNFLVFAGVLYGIIAVVKWAMNRLRKIELEELAEEVEAKKEKIEVVKQVANEVDTFTKENKKEDYRKSEKKIDEFLK